MLAVPQAACGQQRDKLASVVFANVENDRQSTFISAGGKLSLGIGKGVRAFALATLGTSVSDIARWRNGRISRKSVSAEARGFFGLEGGLGLTYISVGIGPSLAQFVDRYGRGRSRAGLAIISDVWHRPSDAIVLIWTSIYDTAQSNLWTRLRYGHRVNDLPFYLGPEVSYSKSTTTRKLRFGAHLSEWKLGPAVFALAAGAMHERRRWSPYVTLTAYINY